MKTTTKQITYAGVSLALCILLPFITLQQQQLGNMFSLIHIPVLLCGIICGWKYGLIVGLIAPLLRHFLFSMPPIQAATLMTFELAAYGAFAGLLYKALPKKPLNVYVTLILAMFLGRIVYGIAGFLLSRFIGISFTLNLFLAKAFIDAVPGIMFHIIVIPLVVFGLQKAKLNYNE